MTEHSEWSERLTDEAIDRHVVKFFRPTESQMAGIRAFAKSMWDAAIDYNISQDAPSAGEALSAIKLRIDNRSQSVSEQKEWQSIRRLIVKLSNEPRNAAPSTQISALVEALEEAICRLETVQDDVGYQFDGDFTKPGEGLIARLRSALHAADAQQGE